ncbi:MAG: DUF1566 domain-containing protein [Planctomycetes bacterium]|nr:DUF1566 domain-containing protein [Planctomycetota bacterium]
MKISMTATGAYVISAVTYAATVQAQNVVVDTGQTGCYNQSAEITCPAPGEPFYGQDSQLDGAQPGYQDNGDGTVTDLNTALMWQKTPDFENKLAWSAAVTHAQGLELAGHDDWRLPTLKELYSLIDFMGSQFSLTPYIDTAYFDFQYDPVETKNTQYWSSTVYVGTTMQGDPTAFGVNFADGRIKGYPKDIGFFSAYVRCVRSDTEYGVNNFVDNGDGTVTDLASGLMWTKADSATEMNWEQALAYAENLEHAGYSDWSLPNAKELQGVVDYTRAPDATVQAQQGPAIDPIFDVTDAESWCWASTTHLDGPVPDRAVYVCFGQAWGYMGPAGAGQWLNVHGAGSQRSDPKDGDPSAFPFGLGPQGDEIRIFNYVRCVRSVGGCSADVTGNGTVDFGDVLAVVGAWGPCTGCPQDLDGDGEVAFSDILAVIGSWGPCP